MTEGDAAGPDRAGRRGSAARVPGAVLVLLALVYTPPAVGWWIGSGDVGPGIPFVASTAVAGFLGIAGMLALVLPRGRAAARLALVLLSVFLLAAVAAEIALRVAIAAGARAIRSPELYADGMTDGDYWKLVYHWDPGLTARAKAKRRAARASEDPEAERQGRGNVHPYFGWAPRVTWENPLGATTRKAYDPDFAADSLLCFGDSFMAGTTPEGTRIPDAIASLLPERTVYNFAMGGYGLGQAFLRFRQEHPRFRRPIVVFGILFVDIDRAVLDIRTGQKPWFDVEEDRLVVRGLPVEGDSIRWIREHPPRIRSWFLAWAVQRLRHLDAGGDGTEYRYGRERKKRVARKIVEEIVAEASEHDLPLVFVVFHSLLDLGKAGWREPFLHELLAETGAPVVDAERVLLDAAREQGRDIRTFFGEDRHLDEEGNRIVARAIVEAVRGRDVR